MSKDYLITIDGGTTNTRVILWKGKELLDSAKDGVGVRDTAIDGNNSRLKNAVKDCLQQLLTRHSISFDDIKAIVASGMITSNVGLVEIPHMVAPVSIDDLANGMQSVSLPDICPLPIWFVPGIKNLGSQITLDDYETMDIMRGEEVESIYMIHQYHNGEPLILVLPGSHTKIVAVDEDGKITGCLTTISGELLSVITNNTIIADAVGRQFVEDAYDKEMVILGYDNAKKVGISRACFSGRILNQFVTDSKKKIANYLLGISLQTDIHAMKHSSAVQVGENAKIVVAGKNPLRQAIVDLLEHDGFFAKIVNYDPDVSLPLSALGAFLVAEKRGIV